jgi:hypothetical protein
MGTGRAHAAAEDAAAAPTTGVVDVDRLGVKGVNAPTDRTSEEEAARAAHRRGAEHHRASAVARR